MGPVRYDIFDIFQLTNTNFQALVFHTMIYCSIIDRKHYIVVTINFTKIAY